MRPLPRVYRTWPRGWCPSGLCADGTPVIGSIGSSGVREIQNRAIRFLLDHAGDELAPVGRAWLLDAMALSRGRMVE